MSARNQNKQTAPTFTVGLLRKWKIDLFPSCVGHSPEKLITKCLLALVCAVLQYHAQRVFLHKFNYKKLCCNTAHPIVSAV